MNIEEYDAYVTSRCKDYCDENYCVIAINGEAGEVAEWYKKFVLRGNITGKFAETDLQEELGDVLFYLTRLGRLRGWSLSQIMDRNASKLDQRVANGMRIIC
jgi:NTP pyrophosphatase (non-canonical NTP hydrolase)